jgi:DNA repair protein RadC
MARRKKSTFDGAVHVPRGVRIAHTYLAAAGVALPAHVAEQVEVGLGSFSAGLREPQQVHVLIAPLIVDSERERFWAIALNGKHSLIAAYEVSVGTQTTSLVHPREVFGPAVRLGASAVVCAHNHPSGDPTPSVEDHQVTRRLVEAGNLLGIPLLDHVVIGNGTYRSLREQMGF